MCIYIYIYIYICVCIYIYIYIYVYHKTKQTRLVSGGRTPASCPAGNVDASLRLAFGKGQLSG